jgi:Tfp pilus assembly protein PilF
MDPEVVDTKTVKPDDLSVTTDMATMYLSRGDANTAIQFYEKVLQQKPEFFEALFNSNLAWSGDV